MSDEKRDEPSWPEAFAWASLLFFGLLLIAMLSAKDWVPHAVKLIEAFRGVP